MQYQNTLSYRSLRLPSLSTFLSMSSCDKPAKARLKLLERRCAALKRQVEKLSSSQELAVLQLLLLDSLCTTFSRLKAHSASQIDASNVELNSCGDLELDSIEQCQLPDDISVVLQEDTENRRIAPRSRPFDLFDQAALQDQNAFQDLTSRQLAACLKEAVLHGSMQLQRQAIAPLDSAACQDSMAQAWNRFLHPSVMAGLNGRAELLAEVTLCDLSTLQPDPAAGAQAADKLASILPYLALTELQLQDIAAGNALFSTLLGNMRQQQEEVLSNSKCSSATDNESSSSLGSLSEGLQARTQETKQLHLLLNKELTLKSAACAYVVGCLSWEQLTKCYIMCWPHPARLPVLMQQVAAYYEQQQAQRQRQ